MTGRHLEERRMAGDWKEGSTGSSRRIIQARNVHQRLIWLYSEHTYGRIVCWLRVFLNSKESLGVKNDLSQLWDRDTSARVWIEDPREDGFSFRRNHGQNLMQDSRTAFEVESVRVILRSTRYTPWVTTREHVRQDNAEGPDIGLTS